MVVNTVPGKTRILILGGGFGGVYTARDLERLCKGRQDIEIMLVSHGNFLLMTPLLFEVCSGALDLRHCTFPIRAFLKSTRVGEGTVRGVDLQRRVVQVHRAGETVEIAYNQLVLALGSLTNQVMIPGSRYAFTFKTLADGMLLRNHLIEQFERADAEQNPQRKRQLVTIVIIGGGLVGVELLGELTAFADEISHYYHNIKREEVRFVMLQGGERIMPEMDAKLAAYGAKVLDKRSGTTVRVNAKVRAIEHGKVHLPEETIEAATIVLAAGVIPSPVVSALPVEKDRHGHIMVDGTMRCKSHPEVWAIGDCASIASPSGVPYPNLAQHALREAKVLARNIAGALSGQPPKPFVYHTMGMMGSLGHSRAFGQMLGLRVTGIPAWFMRRTYYLMQMPGWHRRLRIMIDWTFAFLFRPDITKVSLDSEAALILRDAEMAAATGINPASLEKGQP
jgi:NADH:ubiquinone reductase (H+-translocating)